MLIYGDEWQSLPRSTRSLLSSGKDVTALFQTFRSEGTWNITNSPPHAYAMRNNLPSGMESPFWECPAQAVTNAYKIPALGNPANKPWLSTVATLQGSNNFAYSNYMFFMGEPGNSSRQTFFRDAGMSVLEPDFDNLPLRLHDLRPSMPLAQDQLRIDPATSLVFGNHPRLSVLHS